ncbi:MAG: GGDEF domain-containing protein [Giesbergeria sp.]
MSPILQNLVEMTGHRDHLRLEVSVLSTLQELAGTLEVRALEVFSHKDTMYVRPRTWLENGKWMTGVMEASTDSRSVPLAELPELQQCVNQRANRATATIRKGCYRLWLPVWQQDKLTSCLEITQSRAFSAQKLNVISGVFHVYQNYQSLLDYSERDALTGLFNRKTFDEQFARQFDNTEMPLEQVAPSQVEHDLREESAKSIGQWIAVVDIDHFKLVNDRFGHLYGDEVLILVANILRSSFRSQDRVFRFGGEEFVVLLRSTSIDTARQVFNRFRTTVENHLFPQVGQITVSVGFAAVGSGAPVEILGQADQALYYAKENGRNRVCYYDELIASGGLTAKVSNDDVELF